MNRWDWIIAACCALWLGWMAWLPFASGAVVIEDASLEAMVAGVAIIFSSAFAVAVPILMRWIDAKDAREDALDAAFDMGRWTYAAVAAAPGLGLVPTALEAGLRTQLVMAEHRLSAIALTSLRSRPAARRLRQVQRLARVVIAAIPDGVEINGHGWQTVRRTAPEIAIAVLAFARIVERRPDLTHEEIVFRLDRTA